MTWRHTLTDTLAGEGGVAPPLACGIWHTFYDKGQSLTVSERDFLRGN